MDVVTLHLTKLPSMALSCDVSYTVPWQGKTHSSPIAVDKDTSAQTYVGHVTFNVLHVPCVADVPPHVTCEASQQHAMLQHMHMAIPL